MTKTAIRKKVVDYLQTTADDKKVKAIYLMLEEEIESDSHVPDEETFRELDRRSKSFLDGSAKMYSLEEAKKIARDRLKVKRK